ncbi:MAG TPA: FAD-binding oxidoreductase [Gammaproteobacteria bacterium]|nr:FAD-binding oxidoreductase [Gammaproteobacteria bacterium]
MATANHSTVRHSPSRPASGSRQARLVQPATANELVRVLETGTHYPSPLRALGSASSCTRCTEAAGGTLVDMGEMNRVLRIDRDSVTVQPGITIAELADVLDSEGLETIGGFDYANRTVGGAISAAGLEAMSAGEVGSFSSSVRQIKFVTASGQRGCVNSDTATLLRLFRMSYGLLGIVYEVTLRVRPTQSFEVQAMKIDVADIHNLLARLTQSRSSARLKLFPFRGTVHCELRDSIAGADKGGRLAWRLKSWTVNSAMPAAAFALAKMMPVGKLRYPIVDSLSETTLNLSSLGPLKSGSAAIAQMTQTNVFGAGPCARTSWAFPQTSFASTVTAYFDFCRRHYARTGFRCDQPAVAFPTPKDPGALLSPAFEQSVVTLTAMSNRAEGWDDFAFEYAEFAENHGAIPLFGQSQHMSARAVKLSYGKRWDAFRRTREHFDPERRLVNQFFENFLAI